MKMTFASAIAALVLLSATASHAQVLIDWGTPTQMQGDVDIATNGTYFDAVNTSDVFTTTTVGTTTFNALSGGTDGTISVTYNGGTFTGDGFSSAGSSAAYLTVVNQGSDANLGTVTIGSALHPLTVGAAYQVEVWSVWNHGPYEAYVEGSPDAAFPYSATEYSIGTFTAGGTTETFDWTGNGGAGTYAGNVSSGAYGFLNDVVVESVPEPSTYAMLLASLALLGLCVRRKLA